MKRTNLFLLIFTIPYTIGYNSRIASASEDFDECVMGQMAGQNIYMLPLAQKICREMLPPAPRETVQPVETDLTQEIEHNICSTQGEEIPSICIPNPPKDKVISRVVGFFGNRNPCIIDEQVPLELSGKRIIGNYPPHF
jgi:hypothetical protein